MYTFKKSSINMVASDSFPLVIVMSISLLVHDSTTSSTYKMSSWFSRSSWLLQYYMQSDVCHRIHCVVCVSYIESANLFAPDNILFSSWIFDSVTEQINSKNNSS